MLGWVNMELVVERVVPNPLHVVPVGDNTVFNWVLEEEDTSTGTGPISNIIIFVVAGGHVRIIVLWTTDDGWEDGAWGFTTSETYSAHTGTIIDNNRLNIIMHGQTGNDDTDILRLFPKCQRHFKIFKK